MSENQDGLEFDLSNESPLHSISDAEFDKHKARFMEYALICAAELVTTAGIDELSMLDTLRALLVYAIESGLNNLLFCPLDPSHLKIVGMPPEERAEIDKLWDDGIPWPIVCAVCDMHGVNAMKVLEDHLRENFRKGAANGALHAFSTVVITFGDIDGNAGVFPADLPNGQPAYVLHCSHGGQPCQHPYGTLEAAIQSAAAGIANGFLESIGNITRLDDEIMSAETLLERVAKINNIRNN